MFNFFKKKPPKDSLEKAELLGLITHEELLKLKVERANKDLLKFLKKDEKKGRKNRSQKS